MSAINFWDHMLQLHTWKKEKKIIFRKKIIQMTMMMMAMMTMTMAMRME
jgi:hypothetical protein